MVVVPCAGFRCGREPWGTARPSVGALCFSSHGAVGISRFGFWEQQGTIIVFLHDQLLDLLTLNRPGRQNRFIIFVWCASILVCILVFRACARVQARNPWIASPLTVVFPPPSRRNPHAHRYPRKSDDRLRLHGTLHLLRQVAPALPALALLLLQQLLPRPRERLRRALQPGDDKRGGRGRGCRRLRQQRRRRR